MQAIDLPPVTEGHRRQAFAKLAIRGRTYEEAMRVGVFSKLIEAVAHHLRTKEAGLRRGHRAAWCVETVLGPSAQLKPRSTTPTAWPQLPAGRDGKRAAAGDVDDDDDD